MEKNEIIEELKLLIECWNYKDSFSNYHDVKCIIKKAEAKDNEV